MKRVLVAPITSRVRSIPSELPVGADEGLPIDSVASFDNLQPFPTAMLTRRLGPLADARLHPICAVAGATLDC
jgi:mRNA-degrading endonuclease toxin of MazEF toxin-antitoxin module